MKKTAISVFVALSATLAGNASAHHNEQHESLPVPFEQVFDTAMNDPNVIVYFADNAYRKGDYDSALRWMLEAAQFEHPAAIENARHMIEQNLGTESNRESVVSFLEYFAQGSGDASPELFAQLYLADYYRGDTCVWQNNESKAACLDASPGDAPRAGKHMMKAYFHYENAAEQGDVRARYITGMMNMLGLGVPRNVPLGMEWLRPLAENGNAHIAYLIGSVYQEGFWLKSDRKEATSWFYEAASNGHPGAMLYLGKNAETGAASSDDSEQRIQEAISSYSKLLSGILANDEQRSEAAYRLGVIYHAYPYVRNEDESKRLMHHAVKHAKKTPSTFGVQALIWQGDRIAPTDLTAAVNLYERAVAMLSKLDLGAQQTHAVAWEKLAYAYSTGQSGNLNRDERLYAKYMSERHKVLSKVFVPKGEADQFAGYSAFRFPG